MFHEDQKIICCRVCMNMYGDLSNECGNQWDWERSDSYPKICNTRDSIWDSLIEYNKDKIPCVKFQKLQMEEAQKELPVEQTLLWFAANADANNEPTYNQKEAMTEYQKKLDKLEHPKSLIEAFKNVKKEYANYVKAQENLRKAKEHEAKNWAQIIAEANHHAYYEGDKRGEMKPKTQANTAKLKRPAMKSANSISIGKIDTTKLKLPAMKAADGIRCFYCGKVIQTPEGRNIHCTETEQGLQCQYCKTVNLV